MGGSSNGGDSSSVASKLDGTIDVVQIFSTGSAFAALREDGSVVTWGYKRNGGDGGIYSSYDKSTGTNVTSQLDGTVDVKQVFSNGSAFAALREDGSVVTWGDDHGGGDSSGVASKLDGTIDVKQVFSAQWAFAALREDGCCDLG